MGYTLGQLKEILRQAGWPESLIPIMAAVGMAESTGNPRAINPGRGANGPTNEYSIGLWQINTRAHPQYNKAALMDPLYNAKAALEVFRKQGIRAWGAFTDGNYRKYLNGSDATGSMIPGPIGIGSDILSGVGAFSDLKAYLFDERISTDWERFEPFSKMKVDATGKGRALAATAIIVIVLAFAWSKF